VGLAYSKDIHSINKRFSELPEEIVLACPSKLAICNSFADPTKIFIEPQELTPILHPKAYLYAIAQI